MLVSASAIGIPKLSTCCLLGIHCQYHITVFPSQMVAFFINKLEPDGLHYASYFPKAIA